jgi:hypothetical protein
MYQVGDVTVIVLLSNQKLLVLNQWIMPWKTFLEVLQSGD